MSRVHLPVLPSEGGEMQSSLRADGSRNWVQPADVRGRFARARKVVFLLLVAFWALVPWVRIDGRPALMLDVEHRQFFLFGATFNAQDLWLLFFLLTGIGFSLVFLTSLLGRVWCGWACPQTVFLEGLFRPVERLLEGPREARIRRDKGPWNADKIARKVGKHLAFVVLAAFVAHVFVGYFVSVPRLFEMMRSHPTEHPEAFAWAAALTAVFYGNFARFREQLCIGLCPYGRMQSVLIDQDSLVVGYDKKRGEPRGKASDPEAGACVDCKRCIAVCPTGIDIRNGLQLDCIACTACADACDEVMDKLGRPRGLVRYDSLNGLAGGKTRFLRPRVWLYLALGVLGLVVATVATRTRSTFEANLLRVPGMPFVLDGDEVRNAFTIHLVNKRPDAATFRVEPEPAPGLAWVVPMGEPTVAGLGGISIPVAVTAKRAEMKGNLPIRIRVRGPEGEKVVEGTFVGPTAGIGKSEGRAP
ncbi:cytochrome c oxidase accessory protein CcoG [Polyangium spumosum]|nr:cytochrome c oxidase accessory protein CcoG [Polyangium spumosum]